MTVEAPAAPITAESLAEIQSALAERFPDAVTPESRKGYAGVVVGNDQLVAVARALRDEFGFDYLSSVTGVDYLADGFLESVYHAFSTAGGPAFVFKARAPRDNPVIPSLISVWPGADFQEREAYDLLGIQYAGHPNLKRILLWEGWAGHPLRKDWKEPFFEEEQKPFKSRWPGGHVIRAEMLNTYGKNVQYPAGWTPETLASQAERAVYESLTDLHSGTHQLQTDQIVVNLGPQHPSTHGVFRMVVTLDGETIVDLQPVMGYLHRNHEQIGERNTFIQNMPYTDRLDYISSMANNLAYALTVEKLMNLKVPERAEYLRVIMAELTRIANHMWAIGFLLNDLGAFFTPALYAIEERELILDFFEAVAGSRMMCNYMRFGGVYRDLPERLRDENTQEFLRTLIFERLPRGIDEIDHYLTENEIIRSRCQGVGVLPPDMAIGYSTAGPVLRASGVPYDVRRAEPYGIYPELDFDVAVRYNGDVYDRYLIRIDEMRQSVRILKQAFERMPAGGEVLDGKATYLPKVQPGEAYGRGENPKGELGFYVVSTGKHNPYRYHVRAPSFINLTPLGEMCKGHKVADVVVILGSIDIVLGETDR
jgi:NADH-quinone oxidoreductase subunit D/NADH-quinone oxidoreductase subunit C/D